MAKAKKTTRKARKARKEIAKVSVEATLTPEQLEKLSKLFTVRGVAEVEIPASPEAIIKVKRGQP